MTPEEVVDFFAPEQFTTEAVIEWLAESGISADRVAVSANKQVKHFTSSRSTPSKIVHTDRPSQVDPIRRNNCRSRRPPHRRVLRLGARLRIS